MLWAVCFHCSSPRDGGAPGVSVCACSRLRALQLLGCSSSAVSLLGPDRASPGCSPDREGGWCCDSPILAALCGPWELSEGRAEPEVSSLGASCGHTWAPKLPCQCPLPSGTEPGMAQRFWLLLGLCCQCLPTAGGSCGTAGWGVRMDPGWSCISSVCVCESSPRGNGVCWEDKALENASEVFLLGRGVDFQRRQHMDTLKGA